VEAREAPPEDHGIEDLVDRVDRVEQPPRLGVEVLLRAGRRRERDRAELIDAVAERGLVDPDLVRERHPPRVGDQPVDVVARL
jgi:hypothetical protein